MWRLKWCFVSEHNSPSPHRLRTAARGSAVSYRKALCLNCEQRRGDTTSTRHQTSVKLRLNQMSDARTDNRQNWSTQMKIQDKDPVNKKQEHANDVLTVYVCVCTCLSGRRLLSPRVQSRSILLSGCTPPWSVPRWWPAGGWWQKGNRGCTGASGHKESLPPSAPTAPGWRCEG